MDSYTTGGPPAYRQFPLYGVAGLVLLLVSWILNWDLPGLRTHLLFFPLWLGYCLLAEALVHWRAGVSRLGHDPAGYVLLFFISVPVWWLFEGLNLVTANWSYLGRSAFTDWQFFLLSSLSFSTVIPAVFSTADLLDTFPRLHGARIGLRIHLHRRHYWLIHLAGWTMLALMLAWPKLFFPFLWLGPFFLLDSINALQGKRSLLAGFCHGHVRPLVTYGLGALVCGFFWEMWNFHSFPKWEYHIPYLDFWRVFDMPLAGYGGYIPFGWELYAIYHFLRGSAASS